ncbi:hypothetical protein, conserved [Leishmania tarentolae]|uniref:Rab-GAP TBC domain-containing protein n=1 Tax=Leishmania tarentolae TaxID=5689 RepID=A0A640KJ62_LEITA|nr:hypothetical protein, conserved [Leishmania tarentolae]
MGWRRAAREGFWCNAACTALVLATREARPPRPPAWASAHLRVPLVAPQRGRQEAVSSSTAPTPSYSSGSQRGERLSPSRPVSEGASARGHTDACSASPASSYGRTASSSLAFASDLHSRAVGSEAMLSPSQSYAYVNSAAAVNDAAVKVPAFYRSSSTFSGRTATATSASVLPSMKVAVDGEDELIPAAPGAVRRALLQGHRAGGEGDVSNTSAALLRAVTNPSAPSFRNSSREGGHVPASTASSTPAERHAHRQRQRRTREAREQRRQARAQQQSGAAVHPCRLQGGCPHQLSRSPTRTRAGKGQAIQAITDAGVCPYRHHPSHYCVTQLRDGHCSLYDVGCCPWTHGDLGEGTGRAAPGSVPSDADANLDIGLQGVSPLVPLESMLAEAALRRSAEKVGVILQLFLDTVSVTMEEASAEQQRCFACGDMSAFDGVVGEALSRLPCSWETCAGVARCSSLSTMATGASTSGTQAGAQDRELDLRLEVVPSGDAHDDVQKWRLLSVPVEVALCALASDSEGEASSSFLAAGLGAVDTSPFTVEELGYWSSYFTITASLHEAAERRATTGVGYGADSSLHGVADLPRVRLTPCITSWVLKAAATQMRAKNNYGAVSDGLADEAAFSSAPPTTAAACFEQATLFLLGWRRGQLQRCLIGKVHETTLDEGAEGIAVGEVSTTVPRPSAGPRHEPQRTAESPLRWSSVSFLKDALLCTYLYAAQSAQVSLEQEMMINGEEAGDDGKTNRGINANRRTTLLDVFLEAVCTSGATAASAREASAASVRDGVLFPTEPCHTTALLSSSASAQPSLMTVRSRASASMQRFYRAWDEAHAVVVQLYKGLLQCFDEEVPMEPAVAAPLCLYTQPAMLHVVSSLSVGFARCHETDLRRTVGWQPWSDVQLFLKEHAAVHNADTYARHNMPVVRLGLHNSLLNALLLLTTSHTGAAFHLQESSDVRRVLLSPPAVDFAASKDGTAAPSRTAEQQAVSWWRTAHQEAPVYRQQSLPSHISIAMGFLTALQEHSREQLEARDALMREYEQRRAAYERNHDEKQGSLSHSLTSGGVSRVRKYYASSPHSPEERLVEQQRRLEELRGVALIDRLLPFGSATVSPDATAALLRQLLEGGHPYKALKLAASIVHASRMLRHADKQPRPSLQQGFRTVHTRVWSRRLQRHVLVKKRVPVLRLVGDLTTDGLDDDARPGAQARRSVRPVGLVFAINDRVVVEMVRVGLRMGQAGAALVSGVVQDCQRGALLDFTYRRGLPVPMWEDIADMLSRVRLNRSLSSMMAPASAFVTATASSQQLHEREGRSVRCRSLEGREAALLVIIGVDGGETRLSRGDVDSYGAAHQRIAPTPALLEVLQTHTPPSNTTQHTAYLKLLLQDVARFSTVPVLLALQYQACFGRSRYATSRADGLGGAAAAMQVVYVMTLSATAIGSSLHSPSMASSHFISCAATADGGDASRTYATPVECGRLLQALHAEAEAQLPALQEAILSDGSSLRRHRGAEDDVSSPLSLAALHPNPCLRDVKALLLGTSQEGSTSRPSVGQDEEEGTSAIQAVRRRAKLSLAVLLHHLWTCNILGRSAAQQSTLLWAVCAAMLLGLAESVLLRPQGSSEAEKGRLEGDGAYASLALHHAYVAAGPLLRHVAPRQSPLYVDATVKALLLCRPLACCGDGGKDNGGVGYADCLSSSLAATPTRTAWTDDSLATTNRGEHASGEWPMLLSSATAVRVRSLPAFLALQCSLYTAVYTTEQYKRGADNPSLSLAPTRMASLLESLVAAHVTPPDRVRQWPAWKLFVPLLRQPALAQMWLNDAFLCPSSNLLVWLVGALTRDDVEGYTVLRVWLAHIPAGPHLPPSIREELLAETERRHRSAVMRRLRRQHH